MSVARRHCYLVVFALLLTACAGASAQSPASHTEPSSEPPSESFDEPLQGAISSGNLSFTDVVMASASGVATAQAEPLEPDAEALSQVLAWRGELSKWTATTPSTFQSEGHELAQARGYLNEFAAKRVGSEPFAEGSALALVEETDGKVGRAFFMLKMPAGYDAAGHDWFYAELDASGKALWSGSSAQQQIDRRCASCHRLGAKGSDLVYGPP